MSKLKSLQEVKDDMMKEFQAMLEDIKSATYKVYDISIGDCGTSDFGAGYYVFGSVYNDEPIIAVAYGEFPDEIIDEAELTRFMKEEQLPALDDLLEDVGDDFDELRTATEIKEITDPIELREIAYYVASQWRKQSK